MIAIYVTFRMNTKCRQRASTLRLFARLHSYGSFCFIPYCLVNGLACYPALCGNNSCLCAANIFATPLLPTPANGIKFYLAQTAHPFNRGRVFSAVAMANIVNFDEGLGPLTAAHAVVCI